jgi:three-Cys-motif partner protein
VVNKPIPKKVVDVAFFPSSYLIENERGFKMTPPKKTKWNLDPHGKAKHEILRRYLSRWFPILGSNNQRVVYIDGFCGPGKYYGGEDGSPLIALKLAKSNFAKNLIKDASFLFIDENQERLDSLKYEISQLTLPPNFAISNVLNSFENTMRDIFESLKSKNLQLAPTFAFIDPFGFKGIPFSLIKQILSNKKTEVLINFSQNSINRFIQCNNEKTEQHIIDLLGSNDACSKILYSTNRKETIRSIYLNQLKTCAKFVRFFEMKDRHNRTVYYLFFATNNSLGHVKMKEAFWEVDTEKGYYFSDGTNPQQMVLFKDDPTIELTKIIKATFSGKKILAGQIREFVENSTDYTASHMKKSLIELEVEKVITVLDIKADGKKRIAGKFPDQTIIIFV